MTGGGAIQRSAPERPSGMRKASACAYASRLAVGKQGSQRWTHQTPTEGERHMLTPARLRCFVSPKGTPLRVSPAQTLLQGSIRALCAYKPGNPSRAVAPLLHA
ncbi:hypothetical protein DP113_08225 [Brasilonema octagenarum UFV-E1]|uniref:Uncharacterized protein n=2 Tax=Brasilonema TaxID=383614 RepID=A0A856MFN9_9CYAN|nr:hypothetical protein [Brasilonema octagenarum UFV-OR1]QDL07897.1 hypothetical protein DP114_08270 [Brasilonema sennae CENA114]QDL14257.1 hypothetical protein DP113_08225 [Brasilonema octagenarum UFV-E1]